MVSKYISIIVPSFNEAENIPVLLQAVKSNLKKRAFEIIFIDDGSTDGSIKLLQRLSKGHEELRYISFSRNFGHQSALRAGLHYASGDAVISMDADMQHPPELIPNLIKKWEEGYDIVYTRRNDNEAEGITYFKKISSLIFYRTMNKMSGLKIDPGAADFRLLDRKVVDIINDFQEPDLFLRGLIDWVGFKSIPIDYVPAQRFSGQSKYSLRKMLNFALNGITQFSIKPLRLAIIIGFFMALLGVLYALYAVYDHFIGSHTVSGWTSLVIVVLMTSGIQLMLLGVVGEYVGKTFVQTKSRPDYIVAETNIENDKLNN